MENTNLIYKTLLKQTKITDNYFYIHSVPNSYTAYAKLSPNTTYTIRKIDATTNNNFVVAIYATDLRKATPPSIYAPNWVSFKTHNDLEPHTFTTTETGLHCFIYFTDASEMDTRIMLNEGTEILPYSEPSIESDYYYGLTFNNAGGMIDIDNVNWATPADVEGPRRPYDPKMGADGRIYIPKNDRVHVPLGSFAKTQSLTTVTVPKSVNHIGCDAFKGSTITKLKISRDINVNDVEIPNSCKIKYY